MRANRIGARIGAPAGALLLALTLGACGGYPVGMSAQQGSTIVIPLEMSYVAGVGYGSYNDTTDPTPVTDYQRGTLIYQLVTPNGPFDLVTRMTTQATVPTGSSIARDAQGMSNAEVMSMVDIPANAPLGTYDIQVIHRHTDPATGNQVDDPVSYHGNIAILPGQIDVTKPDGTPETITGQPTPFAYLIQQNGVWHPQDLSPAMQYAAPDPELRVHLVSTTGSNPPVPIWGADVTVSYPASVIDVVDVMETSGARLSHRATVWYQDDGLGNLSIHAAASDQGFSSVSIVFHLDDGASAILDPSQVAITLNHAWDDNGAQLPATASVAGIF